MHRPIQELIHDYVRGLSVYVPGKPIEEVERELKIKAVKLASNENPLGPSPLAAEAVRRAVAEGHRYPDGGSLLLREKLAARHGVKPEQIFVGLGTSEIIDVAARGLLKAGLEGLTSKGTFALYPIAIRAAGARLVETELKEYGFDLEAMTRAITPQTRIIYLANPNNPTGTMFTATEFERFLDGVPEDALVVLDEAYFEYVDHDDYSRSIELVNEGRNLLVLRTFSKVYGLAGLRVGYGIGPVGLAPELNKLRTPFNVSSLAQAAAMAALDDTEHVRRSVEMNRAGMQQLEKGLAEAGLRAVPSVTNFVLLDLGMDATKFSDELLKLGVIVRPMGWMGLPAAVRVTVGTREENEKFLRATAQVWPSLAVSAGAARR
jgi:histidinol-phosphate aminotransferase